MDPSITALIGVIVGSLTTLLAGLLSGRRQAQLKQEKWKRARQDETEKAIRAAVADFTKKLAAGVQVMVWLTWHAKFHPNKLSEASFAEYQKEMKSLYLELVGSRIAVAALSQEVHNRLAPRADALYTLDYKVTVRFLTFQSPQSGVSKSLRSTIQKPTL